MAVYALGEQVPTLHPSAFVHPDAVVIGDVVLGAEASVWPGAVLRGDYGAIRVGAATSIQDGTVVHATATLSTVVGAGCVVGHLAHLEGCTVGDGALVGSGSVLLHRVVVGAGALVAAGAVLTPGTEVPAHALARGVPARLAEGVVVDAADIAATAARYVANAARYREQLRRLD